MRYRLIATATLLALAATVPASAALLAPTEQVPRSTILAGPNDGSDDAAAAQIAVTDYLRTVCPTVMAHRDEYAATFNGRLVSYCLKLRG